MSLNIAKDAFTELYNKGYVIPPEHNCFVCDPAMIKHFQEHFKKLIYGKFYNPKESQ